MKILVLTCIFASRHKSLSFYSSVWRGKKIESKGLLSSVLYRDQHPSVSVKGYSSPITFKIQTQC